MKDILWNDYYLCIKKIYKERKKLHIKKNEIIDGYEIYNWVEEQRVNYRKKKLTQEQIQKLELLGINWWRHVAWMDIYKIYHDYYEENKNIDIPSNYIIDEAYLKEWLLKQKYLYQRKTLSANKIKLLEELEIDWNLNNDFTKMYLIAKKFYEKNGHLYLAENEKVNGYNLKEWLDMNRTLYRNNILSSDKVMLLESIGMEWDLSLKNWNKMYLAALNYYRKHNSINIYIGEKIDGITLGSWIENQIMLYNNKQLSRDKIERLELLEIEWSKKYNWDEMYSLAKHYYELYKNLNVPINYKKSGANLGKWISLQRCAYNNGILELSKINELNKIGMLWVKESKNSSWNNLYLVALNYYNQYHNLELKRNIIVSGVNLKLWLSDQYRRYQLGETTNSESSKLEKIGFKKIKPQVVEDDWNKYYECAKEYYMENKDLKVPRNYTISNIKLGTWIYKMRSFYKEKRLMPIKIHKLETISMSWNIQLENNIERQKENKITIENADTFFEVFEAKFGDYLLYKFLYLLSENMTEIKIQEIKNTLKGIFDEKCYNLFILLLANYDKEVLSDIYCMSLSEIEKLRLNIYTVILKQLTEPEYDKEKQFIISR